MNYTVQELAMKYAESLVEYHTALQSDVCDKDRWVRESRDEMYSAQEALNTAAKMAAELS